MSKIIEPWNNFIIVQKEPKRTETEGGILIPDSATDIVQLVWARVVRVSKKVTDIQVGDRIYIPFDVGHMEEIEGIKYWFLDAANPMTIWGIEREGEVENLKAV
jgi:co-chaperonin GroES (HSP10)